jgi:hypothetical protein
MVDPSDALELDLADLEPTSEVRSIDARVRRLVVDTGLRRAAAEGAWVTISDEAGVVYFEGSPSADGCVDVSLESSPPVEQVRVLVETATQHRQAVVQLAAGWTSHRFA